MSSCSGGAAFQAPACLPTDPAEIEAYLWNRRHELNATFPDDSGNRSGPPQLRKGFLTYAKCLELSSSRQAWGQASVLDAVEPPSSKNNPTSFMDQASALQSLHLEWQSPEPLGPCLGLALHPFRSLVNLYLQYNELEDTVWMELVGLDNLELLALQHNRLTTVQANFQHERRGSASAAAASGEGGGGKALLVLDVGCNRISGYDVNSELSAHFPSSLVMLNVADNPASLDIAVAKSALPNLEVFNKVDVGGAAAEEEKDLEVDLHAIDEELEEQQENEIAAAAARTRANLPRSAVSANAKDELLAEVQREIVELRLAEKARELNSATESDISTSYSAALQAARAAEAEDGVDGQLLAHDPYGSAGAEDDAAPQEDSEEGAAEQGDTADYVYPEYDYYDDATYKKKVEDAARQHQENEGEFDARADEEVLRALAEKKTLLRRKRMLEREMEQAIELFERDKQKKSENFGGRSRTGAAGIEGDDEDEQELRKQRRDLERFEVSLSMEEQYQIWKRARDMAAAAGSGATAAGTAAAENGAG
eukprot:g3122.t1